MIDVVMIRILIKPMHFTRHSSISMRAPIDQSPSYHDAKPDGSSGREIKFDCERQIK